jgi:hypothetical protein
MHKVQGVRMKIQLALVAVALFAFPVFAGATSSQKTIPQPGATSAQGGGAICKSVEDKAIKLVNQKGEVKAWLKLFKGPGNTSPKTGGRPGWQVDGKRGDLVTVRVSEDMPERDVTFGFYDVNLKTGKVRKQH